MQITKRIVIILLVFTITGLLFLPFASTSWAEGVRVGVTAKEAATSINPIAMIKVVVMLGLPGLITVGIRNLIKRPKAKKF